MAQVKGLPRKEMSPLCLMKPFLPVTTFKAQKRARPLVLSTVWLETRSLNCRQMTSVADWICRAHFSLSEYPFVHTQSSLPPLPVCFASLTNSPFSLLRKTFFLGPAHVEKHIPLQDGLECSLHHKTIVSGWDKAPNKAAGRRKKQKEWVPSCGVTLPIHQLKREIWHKA